MLNVEKILPGTKTMLKFYEITNSLFGLIHVRFIDILSLPNNLLRSVIVYYVPRRIMRVITRRATMLAGDRSQGIVEVMMKTRALDGRAERGSNGGQ